MKQQPGYIGPLIAIGLAVLLGGLALRAHNVERARALTAWRAETVAGAIAQTDEQRQSLVERLGKRSDGILQARAVARVERPSRYPFLRRLNYEAHVDPGRVGTRLVASDDADKASADAYVAGLQGAAVAGQADGAMRAAQQIEDRATVVVVDGAPIAPVPIPLVLLLGVSVLAVLVWAAAVRLGKGAGWPAAAGSCVAAGLIGGVLVTGMAQADDAARSVVGALGEWMGAQAALLSGAPPAGWSAGTAIILGSMLIPLTLYGVVGTIRGSGASPHRAAYTYVAPALVGLSVLILVPFVVGFGLAFTRHDHGTFTWVGLQNFVHILASEGYGWTHPLSFYYTLVVTIVWTALNVFLHAAIGLGLALILREPTLRLRGIYRVMLIVPWAVPNYITALVWKGMFNKQYGLVNHLIGLGGIEPVGWFSTFAKAFTANLTTNTWLGFPFMMLVALGALQSIPRDLYEAAEVDGASRWDQFRQITLPLLKPAMFPAIILGSIWTFNMFNIIYLVSGGQPNNSTDILITEAYRWAFERDRYGYAAAYSVLIFIILLGYSTLTNRMTRATEGAFD